MPQHFDPEPGIQTPGLSLTGGGGTPRIQQLMGVVTGHARSAMDAERRGLMADEQAARTQINSQMAMDKAANQTAAVYQQAVGNIQQAQRVRRVKDAQVKNMNMLLQPGSDNPEWLHRHATAEYQNAATPEEKSIWFGTIQRANAMREQQGLTQAQHETQMRKRNYDLAQQTARIELSRVADRIENDPRLRQQLIANGENIHERLIEFVIGQVAEAVPELANIRRSDPQYKLKTQMRDDLILGLTEQSRGMASRLVGEHRQLGDESALMTYERNTSAAIDSMLHGNLDSKLAVNDFLSTIEEQMLWNGGALRPSQRQAVVKNLIDETMKRLGRLDNDLSLERAFELKDELLTALQDKPELRQGAKDVFDGQLGQSLDRRINRDVQNNTALYRQGNPLANSLDIAKAMLQDDVLGTLHQSLRDEAGVPFDKSDLTDREAAIASAIDQKIEGYLAGFTQMVNASVAKMTEQQKANLAKREGRRYNPTDAYRGSALVQATEGELSPDDPETRLLEADWQAYSDQPMPWSIEDGPLDWENPDHAPMFEFLAVREASLLNNNADSDMSPEQVTDLSNWIKSNNTAQVSYATKFINEATPTTLSHVRSKADPNDWIRLQRAAMMARNGVNPAMISAQIQQLSDDVLQEAGQRTETQRREDSALTTEQQATLARRGAPVAAAVADALIANNLEVGETSGWFRNKQVGLRSSDGQKRQALIELFGNAPGLMSDIYTLTQAIHMATGKPLAEAASEVINGLVHDGGYRPIKMNLGEGVEGLRFMPTGQRKVRNAQGELVSGRHVPDAINSEDGFNDFGYMVFRQPFAATLEEAVGQAGALAQQLGYSPAEAQRLVARHLRVGHSIPQTTPNIFIASVVKEELERVGRPTTQSVEQLAANFRYIPMSTNPAWIEQFVNTSADQGGGFPMDIVMMIGDKPERLSSFMATTTRNEARPVLRASQQTVRPDTLNAFISQRRMLTAQEQMNEIRWRVRREFAQ